METALLEWIHSLSNPVWDRFFKLSDFFGRSFFIVPAVLAALTWNWHRNRKNEILLWVLLSLNGWLLIKGLKLGIGRARPELWDWAVSVKSYSLPSGHALAAATLFPLMARLWIQWKPTHRKRAMTATVLMVLYVGIGRLYLGVHWPTDVLAGWIVGGTQTWVGFRIAARYNKN
ncbi:MAG TPA: phosphatase PAP2 family protein [Verrucomicrobia bacterium]|nr:phosphatase PAP2 family protein [Verrucomicrobiota bacterium]